MFLKKINLFRGVIIEKAANYPFENEIMIDLELPRLLQKQPKSTSKKIELPSFLLKK